MIFNNRYLFFATVGVLLALIAVGSAVFFTNVLHANEAAFGTLTPTPRPVTSTFTPVPLPTDVPEMTATPDSGDEVVVIIPTITPVRPTV